MISRSSLLELLRILDDPNKKCSQPEKDHVIRSFLKAYLDATEGIQETDRKKLETARDTLMKEGNIDTYIRDSKSFYEKYEKNFRIQYQQESRNTFWWSVLASIVGTIAYSILLIIFFYLAQDQLSSWINSIPGGKKESPKTESIRKK
ncbi:hypothetical protein EHQ57_09930 [Leptospira wolffii]|uniref:hypothetical protein n=1 Tax=Leptospira wolffii TaxID=409998 RepID=UPI001083ECBB|nr:hypothetical protein [Leptospira wolffii]TGK71473.1 hypothetical protein EHQ35_15225 [Leptospira wolffii]TGL29250.1 hypothetical protein EHQ57_09930 [Leptospira wolffii]